MDYIIDYRLAQYVKDSLLHRLETVSDVHIYRVEMKDEECQDAFSGVKMLYADEEHEIIDFNEKGLVGNFGRLMVGQDRCLLMQPGPFDVVMGGRSPLDARVTIAFGQIESGLSCNVGNFVANIYSPYLKAVHAYKEGETQVRESYDGRVEAVKRRFGVGEVKGEFVKLLDEVTKKVMVSGGEVDFDELDRKYQGVRVPLQEAYHRLTPIREERTEEIRDRLGEFPSLDDFALKIMTR